MKSLVKAVHRIRNKLQLRFWAVLLVFGLMFYFAMVQGGFISWFLFYTFLPVVLYLSLLILYPSRWITAARTFRNRETFAGDIVRVGVDLSRKVALPFFMIAIHETTEAQSDVLQNAGYPMMPFWGGRNVSLTGQIPNIGRGIYTLSAVQVELGDPFGFFLKKFTLPCKDTLTVYPKIGSLGVSALIRNGPARSLISGDTDIFQFSGLRDYQPSDRLSWMDWKASARKNELVARQFEPETDRHVSVVLVTGKEDKVLVFERTVSFAASLVIALLNDGFTVQLLVGGSPAHKLDLRTNGKRERSAVLHLLAGLKQGDEPVPAQRPAQKKRGQTVVAVTTASDSGGQLSEFLSMTSEKNYCFYVSDPDVPMNRVPAGTVLFCVPADDFSAIQKVSR
jgi:Uncharacterized conserved protein (some members contain a von Willebrand factor type A (vWA) domain)